MANTGQSLPHNAEQDATIVRAVNYSLNKLLCPHHQSKWFRVEDFIQGRRIPGLACCLQHFKDNRTAALTEWRQLGAA